MRNLVLGFIAGVLTALVGTFALLPSTCLPAGIMSNMDFSGLASKLLAFVLSAILLFFLLALLWRLLPEKGKSVVRKLFMPVVKFFSKTGLVRSGEDVEFITKS